MSRRAQRSWLGWLLALLVDRRVLRGWASGSSARMHEKQAMLAAVHAGAAAARRRSRWRWPPTRRARAATTGPRAAAASSTRRPCCSTTSRATTAPACAPIACSAGGAGRAPLLVELGWLPLPGDRALPPVAASAGRAAQSPACWRRRRRTGIMRRGRPTPQPDGSCSPPRSMPPTCARALGSRALAPRVLQARSGDCRWLCARPRHPAQHAAAANATCGYAVQWFALALAVLATALRADLPQTANRA